MLPILRILIGACEFPKEGVLSFTEQNTYAIKVAPEGAKKRSLESDVEPTRVDLFIDSTFGDKLCIIFGLVYSNTL
jgi:hypothetical protein